MIRVTTAALISVMAGAAVPTLTAQETAYKFDLGTSLGMSGYLGDANTANFLKHPGVSGNVSMRYLIDTRWAARGVFSVSGLRGNSADMTNVFPEGETFDFTSTVYDLGGRIEFNFFNYGIGERYKKLCRWTPYLSVGAGVTIASCEGTYAAFNIPMGAGVKYKLTPRLNLGFEWAMTKVFGDRVDGEKLHDLQGIKSSFIKNTDWYSTMTVSISFEFGERCSSCFYVD